MTPTRLKSRAEKLRQFSSPTTPRFEQSSAGYHRLPPAIAVTLAAGGRRQFHWHSPAPPAFTGSTSIHRLHRIVMGRYIDNYSSVKMVYLQLPIAVQLQIKHFNAAGIIGISSRNDPQTTSLRRAPRNMSCSIFSLGNGEPRVPSDTECPARLSTSTL